MSFLGFLFNLEVLMIFFGGFVLAWKNYALVFLGSILNSRTLHVLLGFIIS
jgi:hypothetical protein